MQALQRTLLVAGGTAIAVFATVSLTMTHQTDKKVGMTKQASHVSEVTAGLDRYYAVHLIWVKDAEKWARYRELVAPIARRYGAVERSLRPDKIYFEGRGVPDLVNVVYSASRQDLERLEQDRAFQEIVHLRSESTELISVFGAPLVGEVSSRGVEQRAYLVEIAQFGPEGAAGYRRYEEASEPVLRRYGYHVERVVSVREHSTGLPFRPDVVKVAYFEQPDGMARMEADADHDRVEALYPAAVTQSIWVFGKTVGTD